MSEKNSGQIRIPESALKELEWVENMDWEQGVSLTVLIDWVNDVVEMYRPSDQDSRSSPNFTQRSFRHYQTLGCIDSPRREGKHAMYGFRHYLQALLIRKLLWERVPSAQITSLLDSKTNEQYKQLLFEGIAIIPGSSDEVKMTKSQNWKRLILTEGVELNLALDRSDPLSEDQIEQALVAVAEALRSL